MLGLQRPAPDQDLGIEARIGIASVSGAASRRRAGGQQDRNEGGGE
jgi:hypothetical protein